MTRRRRKKEQRRSELAPCFLVAAPSLTCPIYRRSVILLVDHNEDGAFGLVINRPADVRFRQVLGDVGIEVDPVSPPEAPVMVGGPVSPGTGWIIYDPAGGPWPRDEMVQVADRIAVSASYEMLEALASGHGPKRRLMMLGYAGWGPGQLEEEIAEGSWIPVDLDARLVFETPPEDRWSAALATFGIDPAWVTGLTVGEA